MIRLGVRGGQLQALCPYSCASCAGRNQGSRTILSAPARSEKAVRKIDDRERRRKDATPRGEDELAVAMR